MFLSRQHTKPAWDVAPFLVVYVSLHLIASPLFIFLKVDEVFAVRIERGILLAKTVPVRNSCLSVNDFSKSMDV